MPGRLHTHRQPTTQQQHSSTPTTKQEAKAVNRAATKKHKTKNKEQGTEPNRQTNKQTDGRNIVVFAGFCARPAANSRLFAGSYHVHRTEAQNNEIQKANRIQKLCRFLCSAPNSVKSSQPNE